MTTYDCSTCGKSDVRLYRVGGMFADTLYCQACSEKTGANLVPAIVVGHDENGELFFAQASTITPRQLEEWKGKPIF